MSTTLSPTMPLPDVQTSQGRRRIGPIQKLLLAIANTEPRNTTAPATTAKPVTEDELHVILDRLEAARDIFRQNRELGEVLSRREGEIQALRSHNAELEEIMRKFTPMLLNAAFTMGLAAKNEKPDTPRQP